MKNFIFYTLTVFIWGSTWLAIKFQLGTVDPMVSVAYRFSLAAFLLILWCILFRLKMKFTVQEHFRIALQGAFLFGLNYLLFYIAELTITSGLAAVIFSTILVMNMINGAIFLGSPFNKKVIAGGVLGLSGIVLVFEPEVTSFNFAQNGLQATALCFGATFLASIGNIISAYNQKKGLPIVQTNAYGMGYGAVLMLLLSFLTGKEFAIVFSFSYISSLFYLSVFGSIIAFGCYLTLVGNIGADRAAYSTLLFPIVALAFSTIWENYQWSVYAITGVVLILSGNLLMIKKKKNDGGTTILQTDSKIGKTEGVGFHSSSRSTC